jgi:hypothetical protein
MISYTAVMQEKFSRNCAICEITTTNITVRKQTNVS